MYLVWVARPRLPARSHAEAESGGWNLSDMQRGKLGKKGYVSGSESHLSWLQCSGRDTIPDRLEKDAQNNLLNDPISCG